MNTLKRIIAMLAASVIFPLRTVYVSVKTSILMGFVALVTPIGILVVFYKSIQDKGWNQMLNLFLTIFAVLPIALVLTAAVFSAALSYVAGLGLLDFGRSLWQGLQASYHHGFVGLKEVWSSYKYEIESWKLLNDIFGTRSNNRTDDNQGNDAHAVPASAQDPIIHLDEDGFQIVPAELEDVVVSRPKPQQPVKLTEIKCVPNSALLTPTELDKLNQLSSSGVSQFPTITTQFNTFKIMLVQYTDLSKTLDEVQELLRADKGSEIQDGLMSMEITDPVLTLKQYQKENGAWGMVPATAHVTDWTSFVEWLNHKTTHPITRDDMINPTSYLDRPSRYVWHPLTKENCYTPGLGECAKELRRLSEEILTELTKQKDTRVSSSPNTLFAHVANATQPHSAPSAEIKFM